VLFFLSDDASVVHGVLFAQKFFDGEEIFGRQAHFREQAELIDRRFDDSFRTQAELIDKLFAYRFEELDKKWGPRFENVERDIGTLKADVSSLKKDMVIVREGIAILLKRA
jgi:hypothetical protein